MEKINWSIQTFWNESILTPKDRPAAPRDILFAGEIGNIYLDIFWKLMGEEETNRPSPNARRKMEAGNFVEAWIVWVFKRCGILKKVQGKARLLDRPEYLSTYGRYDLQAGCDGNWADRRRELNSFFQRMIEHGFDFPLMDKVKERSFALIDGLSKKFPDGLIDKIVEVKSLNSNAFWKNSEIFSQPYEHHQKQLTFYLMHNEDNIQTGEFIYMDRDSTMVSVIPFFVKPHIKEEIYDWLSKMTQYYRTKTEPPPPQLKVFDAGKDEWQFNWQVGYSNFKDRHLKNAGLTEEQLQSEIKEENSILKEVKKLKNAKNGETFFGSIKAGKILKMLDEKIDVKDISSKMGISEEALNRYVTS